jgi:hypothetical protein
LTPKRTRADRLDRTLGIDISTNRYRLAYTQGRGNRHGTLELEQHLQQQQELDLIQFLILHQVQKQ